jgi:hypothetical protein
MEPEVMMDPKRIGIGALIGTVVFNVTGFLVWGMLLLDFFTAHAGSAVGLEKDPPTWWAVVLGGLLFGALLTMILDWSGSSSLGDAAMTSAIVGLLFVGGMDFLYFGLFNIFDLAGTVADTVLSALQWALTGVAIAAATGRGVRAKTAA